MSRWELISVFVMNYHCDVRYSTDSNPLFCQNINVTQEIPPLTERRKEKTPFKKDI